MTEGNEHSSPPYFCVSHLEEKLPIHKYQILNSTLCHIDTSNSKQS